MGKLASDEVKRTRVRGTMASEKTSVPCFIPPQTPMRRQVIRQLVTLFAGLGLAAGSNPFGHLGTANAQQPARREDATRLNAGGLSDLDAAIGEMMERSRKNAVDPHGWSVNARGHADFCGISSKSELQVHFCWWFLSWHRAFLVITERKLREIAGKSSLALPYWNWSSDRNIPPMFLRDGSALAQAVRNVPKRQLSDGEVDYFRADPARAKLGVAALGAEKFEALKPEELIRTFGGIARPNAPSAYGNSRLESVPHGPVHNYVGGDMADFVTAARDPIFFAHHANLDRLWEIWRSDPKKRATEPTAPLFLKHQFPFSWLDGSTTTISVEETLDTQRLGYTYDSLLVFRGSPPESARPESAVETLPPILESTLAVPRPPEAARRGTRYTLVIRDVEPPTQPMNVEVRVRRAQDKQDAGMLVGSFAAVLVNGRVVFPDATLRFDVTEAVRRLGSSRVAVSLIPLPIGSRPPENIYPQLRYNSIAITTGD